MANIVRETRTVEEGIEDNTSAPARNARAGWTAAQIIYLISGVIMAVLGFRFLLSLFGANRGNAFASFIYDISHPFAAPFFGLFNYQAQYGVSRFEFETLIAIAFYGFVAWVLVWIVTIGSKQSE